VSDALRVDPEPESGNPTAPKTCDVPPAAVARLRPDARVLRGLDPRRWYSVLPRAPRRVPKPTTGQLWLDLQMSERSMVTIRAEELDVRELGGAPPEPLALARLAGRVSLGSWTGGT
jgi:hypothetical protein